MTVTVIPIMMGARIISKGLERGLEVLKIGGPIETINSGQNTEKSSGDPRKLTVTQTPVKYHQLTLVKLGRGEIMRKKKLSSRGIFCSS